MNTNLMNLPVLPLRGLNIFPNMIITFDVRRRMSIEAIERAMNEEQLVFVTAQKDASVEIPSEDDVYECGVIAKVKQVLKLPKNNLRVLVEGIKVAYLLKFTKEKPYIRANGSRQGIRLKHLTIPLSSIPTVLWTEQQCSLS